MQLLIVEDNVADAELTVGQLRADGIECTWTRVATEDAFRDALLSAPDLIISDCTLPYFDGVSAFSIAAEETPEIPFVFVSGTLGDERARNVPRLCREAVCQESERGDQGKDEGSAHDEPAHGSSHPGHGGVSQCLRRHRDVPSSASSSLRASPLLTSKGSR